VQFAERARYDALPPDIVRACKVRLLDTFASALGAYDEQFSVAARKAAARTRGVAPDGEASVWGSDIRTTPEMAAFTNGVMVRVLDISDTYMGRSRGHPSDMTSGLIAVAKRPAQTASRSSRRSFWRTTCTAASAKRSI
jgi:2-methylcitrate dehydratase